MSLSLDLLKIVNGNSSLKLEKVTYDDSILMSSGPSTRPTDFKMPQYLEYTNKSSESIFLSACLNMSLIAS